VTSYSMSQTASRYSPNNAVTSQLINAATPMSPPSGPHQSPAAITRRRPAACHGRIRHDVSPKRPSSQSPTDPAPVTGPAHGKQSHLVRRQAHPA
jgi:hypothetical protein